jgi:transcriptional regulator with PAS, ATPase and Fis domain
MNKKNIYINIYLLIPFIFAGISVISAITTYQLFNYYQSLNIFHPINMSSLIICIGFIVFILSVIILHIILKPIDQFINKTQKMPIFQDSCLMKEKILSGDMYQVAEIFDKVSNILNSVEAKELFPHIITSSSSMRSIFAQILKVAPTDSTVFISGESGTGKELIAEGIYEHSTRKGKPFIKINCVAIPEGLLESELFGHEKGSFTGAISQKKGKFEIADGGTIFLDEIGDMPLTTQAKLLRVLQEKEIERVGGSVPIKIDVRFIAATNKNLKKMIKEGLFREDLYFRINVFAISAPPLRDRQEDISVIANYFLESLTKKAKLSTTALQLLIGYDWPGNIRELKNILEQAAILTENGIIEIRHLPDILLKQNQMNVATKFNDKIALDDKLKFMEKEMIVNALRKTGGVQVKAAYMLGINQRSLWHRIKKLNIDINIVRHLQ